MVIILIDEGGERGWEGERCRKGKKREEEEDKYRRNYYFGFLDGRTYPCSSFAIGVVLPLPAVFFSSFFSFSYRTIADYATRVVSRSRVEINTASSGTLAS